MFIADEIVEAGTLGGGGGENASQDVSLTSRLLEAFTQFLVQFSFVPPPEKRWRWSSGHLGDALRCADKKGNAKAWFGKREWSGDEEGESVREEERRDRREEVGREGEIGAPCHTDGSGETAELWRAAWLVLAPRVQYG